MLPKTPSTLLRRAPGVSEGSLSSMLPRMAPVSGRAAALPPEERREALIAATLPLVLEHGTDVSTRLIAEAAGVAEGTIFRAFPSKQDLMEAVLASAFDPSTVVDAIAELDRTAPLQDRLIAAVELMQARGRRIAGLLHAFAAHGSLPHREHDRDRGWRVRAARGPGGRRPRAARRARSRAAALLAAGDGTPAAADHPRAEQPSPGRHRSPAARRDRLAAARRPAPARPGTHPVRPRDGGPRMLMRLLRSHLQPYRRPLLAVVAFQLVSTLAALSLPSLNARIIDDGIATGDTGAIMRIGGVMLGITVVQIACSIAAVWFGARTAMAFGRDVRTSVFSRVGTFSAQEMARFGAPSLITRTTNDVQQVQMLVVMTCTLMIGAPIMCIGGVVMALREDVVLSWLMLVCVPV